MTDSLEKRTNDFIEKLKDVGYTYVSGYKDVDTSCTVKCPNGHLWKVSPTNFKRNYRCALCKKNKLLIERLNKFKAQVEKEHYTYISGFKNSYTKCVLKCPKGHIYQVRPSDFIQNKRCPTCAGHKRIYEPEFKQWCNENLDSLEYISGYTKSSAKCNFKCLKCHRLITTLTPNNVRSGGRRCPFCSLEERRKKDVLPLENFTNWLNKHDKKIKYISGYVDTKTPCKLQCLVCGKYWNARPGNIKSGRGCKYCAGRIRIKSRVVTESMFVDRLSNINKNIEYVSGYVNTHTKCTMKCLICGNVWNTTTPHSLMRGGDCPKCANAEMSKQDFINFFKENISKAEYLGGFVDMNTPCNFRCNTCGYEYSKSPRYAKSFVGCKQCHAKKIKEINSMSLVSFKEKLKKCNPTIEYTSGYINASTPCMFKCLICKKRWSSTRPTRLIHGATCPNCSLKSAQSKGEKYISIFLKKNGCAFEYPKKFPELYDNNPNYPLHYDFCLPKFRVLIEYQGSQHYKPVDWFGGIEKFAIQNLHDDMKRYYAKSNHYTLIEVPYTYNTQGKVSEYLKEKLKGVSI